MQGMRRSRSWAQEQVVYFVACFNRPVRKLRLALNDTIRTRMSKAERKNIKAVFDFERWDGDSSLLIKVGISAVDWAGARKNLHTELPDWDFEQTKAAARKAWNR